jgi:hypothetical protein
MTTQAVGAGKGFAWVLDTLGLIRRHPAQMLGGAGWVIGVTLAVMVAFLLLNVGAMWLAAESSVVSSLIGLLLSLPLMYVFVGLFIGYLRMVHKLDAGEPASATQIFEGLRDVAANVRAFGVYMLLLVATYLLAGMLVAVLAPDVGRWYLDAMMSSPLEQPAAPPPGFTSGFFKVFPILLALCLFTYVVQGIGVAQVALRDRGVIAAIGDGFTGVARNLIPLLMLLVAAVSLWVVIALGFGILLALVMAAAHFTTQWLLVLAVPLYLLLCGLAIAISYGMGYHLWRDICGGAPAPEVAA